MHQLCSQRKRSLSHPGRGKEGEKGEQAFLICNFPSLRDKTVSSKTSTTQTYIHPPIVLNGKEGRSHRERGRTASEQAQCLRLEGTSGGLHPQELELHKEGENNAAERKQQKNNRLWQLLNSLLSSASLAQGLRLPKSQRSADSESLHDTAQASLSASPIPSQSWSTCRALPSSSSSSLGCVGCVTTLLSRPLGLKGSGLCLQHHSLQPGL